MEWGPTIRPTRAEINLDSVVANSRLLATMAHSEILAVVKADAYGHGACEVSRALEDAETVTGFAVSLVEEGIELRRAGITLPILVMGPSLVNAHTAIVENALTPLISDERHLMALDQAANRAGRVLDVHLKVDTGMGRLGIRLEEFPAVVARVEGMASLRLTAVASHLACADIDDALDERSMTALQLRRFAALVREWPSLGAHPVLFHVANSAAIVRFPESRYDLARPGLALYGNGGFVAAEAEEPLRQAMSLRSEVTQIRQVRAGESVSYGARWTADRASLVALVPVGYADGLPRNLTGKGSVLTHQERCAIVGTVSMDMIVVDVSDLESPAIGDDVVLFGRQGAQEILVAEIAAHCGISEYEVTCGISKRVPRTYLGGHV